MSWTDERVTQLKTLWDDGLSASQIAAALGGITRNSVISKVHRLNLPGRKTVIRAPIQPRHPRRDGQPPARQFRARWGSGARDHRATVIQVSAAEIEADARREEFAADTVPELTPEQMARTVPLLKLTPRTCRWPYGDPLKPDFVFCGDTPAPDKPYCAAHCRIAYQRPGARAHG